MNTRNHENTHTHTHKQHPEIRSTSLQHVSIYKASSDRTESPARRAGRSSDSSTGSDDIHTPTICVCMSVYKCMRSHHLILVKKLVPHSKLWRVMTNDWPFKREGEGLCLYVCIYVRVSVVLGEWHKQHTHSLTNLERAGRNGEKRSFGWVLFNTWLFLFQGNMTEWEF